MNNPMNRFADKKNKNSKKKQRTVWYVTHYGRLAAACLLAIAVTWRTNEINLLSGTVGIVKAQVLNSEDDVLSDMMESEALAETSADIYAEPEDAFSYAENYEEIYNALRDATVFCEYEEMELGMVQARTLSSAGAAEDMVVEDTAVAESFDMGAGTSADIAMERSADGSITEPEADGSVSENSTTDFSDTNKQEVDVDEADIVKTDGNYIYILRNDCTLAIVKADGADSGAISITQIADQSNSTIQEMYLDGDTLNILVHQAVTSLETAAEKTEQNGDSGNHSDSSGSDLASSGESDSEDITCKDIYYTKTTRQTALYTYDITDRSAPILTGTVTQEGYYSDSRKVESHIYLFTIYHPDVRSTYSESTIIPRINGEAADASAFYLPKDLTDTTYLIISSVDTAAPYEVQDSKILVSGASNFYVSTENIYIANETYSGSDTITEITKFHYANGIITGVAAASVKGYLNNSFSMNEYNGHLRVVTTYYGNNDWTEHNGLFILDETLQQTGSIEDLAAGETIRSARFLGDTGYFVTFRQTDPLFSVDLSDPANPQILGELKISGFSSYLHFYGTDLLLGIGYEADETTGITTGLKLSMFDISDPANVTEINRLVLPGVTWCPAIENYKSILVQPEKNLIGFFCDNRYLTFSWDLENGFAQELIYDFYSDMLVDKTGYDTVRGLYIEDTLYVAGETFLVSFDIGNAFEKMGMITF